MFNLAVRWDMRTDNPAAGFIRNPENPRERFLNLDEITKVSELLAGCVQLLRSCALSAQ
jgi:hypothetical protein